MELTKLSIADLTPHPQNYNTHPEEQLLELEKSLESFDQYKNIVVCQGVIIAGHGLVEAAKRKGMTEIYALVRDDMTEEQQLALLVSDNATPAGAFPDVDKLNSIFDNIDPFTVPGITQEWLDTMDITNETAVDEIDTEEAFKTLSERFIVPPFSVFDTRQGYWQERKKQWLSLGIQSELGRC